MEYYDRSVVAVNRTGTPHRLSSYLPTGWKTNKSPRPESHVTTPKAILGGLTKVSRGTNSMTSSDLRCMCYVLYALVFLPTRTVVVVMVDTTWSFYEIPTGSISVLQQPR